MSLPKSAHTDRPWRVHEITDGFRLEDVWELPTPGGRDDFRLLVQGFTEMDPGRSSSRAARSLFALRWRIGDLLGLDDEAPAGGPTIRDRLPADLREADPGPDFRALPFTALYLLDDEFAAEVGNRTMHGVMHLGWVEGRGGFYHGQMAVLVRPNGLLGNAYMAAIKPFRHQLVYPPMLRDIGRDWRRRVGEGGPEEVAG